MSDGEKKDRSHLEVVGKEKLPHNENDVNNKEDSMQLYEKITATLTKLHFSEWGEYLVGEMSRDSFIRTIAEFDDLGYFHPVFVYDSAPAPTANTSLLTPEKYGILDLVNLTHEDEDRLLWEFECESKDYRVVFIPKELVYHIEGFLFELLKQIIAESKNFNIADFNPATMLAFVRKYRMVFNNIVFESGLLDDEFDRDGVDETFEDEIFEDDDDTYIPDELDQLHDKTSIEMESSSLTQLDFGRYKIIMLWPDNDALM